MDSRLRGNEGNVWWISSIVGQTMWGAGYDNMSLRVFVGTGRDLSLRRAEKLGTIKNKKEMRVGRNEAKTDRTMCYPYEDGMVSSLLSTILLLFDN